MKGCLGFRKDEKKHRGSREKEREEERKRSASDQVE